MYSRGDKCDESFIGPLLDIVRKKNRALPCDAVPFPQFEQKGNFVDPLKLLDENLGVIFNRTC